MRVRAAGMVVVVKGWGVRGGGLDWDGGGGGGGIVGVGCGSVGEILGVV